MAVKIDGTMVKKSSGGGLGKLLGTLAGGVGGFMLAGPAGALKGASLGGGLGGAIGGAVAPGSAADLGVGVKGASGQSTAAQPDRTSAIDRINGLMDVGQTVAGGADALKNMRAPKIGALGNPMAVDSSNAFSRRLNAGSYV